MKLLLSIVTIFVSISLSVIGTSAQDGPAPPRLSIPGAVPIPIRPQLRNDKLGPLIRVRKPFRPQPINSLPIPVTPRILQEEPKPVTEEPEDESPETFIPPLFSQQPQNQQQNQPQFNPEPQNLFQDSQIDEQPPQSIIQRYQPQEKPQRFSPPEIQTGAQRFALNADRPKTVIRRPVNREPRPQFDQESLPANRQGQSRSTQRPVIQNNVNIVNDARERKPVAQILRKYREEHEDGSITWGFENDDGSFKEETIGYDCITRGRYGYIDPDGLKREYSYETGILCDPNTRDQNQELEQAGFVDYEGNKAVLPNGVEIDLSNMGKKKSKRPGAVLQQYRN